LNGPHFGSKIHHSKSTTLRYRVCAFDCNLKRCKRTGRRKNLPVRRKYLKTREHACVEICEFPAQRKSANSLILTSVSPVVEWRLLRVTSIFFRGKMLRLYKCISRVPGGRGQPPPHRRVARHSARQWAHHRRYEDGAGWVRDLERQVQAREDFQLPCFQGLDPAHAEMGSRS